MQSTLLRQIPMQQPIGRSSRPWSDAGATATHADSEALRHQARQIQGVHENNTPVHSANQKNLTAQLP